MSQENSRNSNEENESSYQSDRAVLKDKHAGPHIELTIMAFILVLIFAGINLLMSFTQGNLSSSISQSFSSVIGELEKLNSQTSAKDSSSKSKN